MQILMVTIGYPPSQVGGTEIYVQGLVNALEDHGHVCSVAYVDVFSDEGQPGLVVEARREGDTNVFAIKVNTTQHKPEFILFDKDLRALLLREFQRIVRSVGPDIVHVHPLQLGFESYLIEDLRRSGHRVVLTYHSTTTTCARGDLIHMGRDVCDGVVCQERCSKCFFQWKGVPEPAAKIFATLPINWFRATHMRLKRYRLLKRFRSFASIPLIIEERRKAWTRATEHANAIVAVCQWVQETIVKNGVCPEKVLFSRHGLRFGSTKQNKANAGPARFGYLGRISPEKGIDLLARVLSEMPQLLEYEFEFCSSTFNSQQRSPEEEKLIRSISQLQQNDNRVKVLGSVRDDRMRSVLAKWDAMVVPSLWLESGPQVVYEAFAVQTPILGTRLGGIAELVHDGVTGFLFTRNSAEELSELLCTFARDPGRIRALRENIPLVRTTRDVADDMLRLYEEVVEKNPEAIECAVG